MPLTDDELLDFDVKGLGGFHTPPRQLLADHGDLYRSHLLVARWMWGYHDRRAESPGIAGSDERFDEGVRDTLRDLAANLRQGDFLPGGALYEDEQERHSS